jgi:hypothetical protein
MKSNTSKANAGRKARAKLLENLRAMLRDVFELRTQGVAYARLARAHGYVDGYMRVLLETGLATRQELLALVSEERTRADGPATQELTEQAAAVA